MFEYQKLKHYSLLLNNADISLKDIKEEDTLHYNKNIKKYITIENKLHKNCAALPLFESWFYGQPSLGKCQTIVKITNRLKIPIVKVDVIKIGTNIVIKYFCKKIIKKNNKLNLLQLTFYESVSEPDKKNNLKMNYVSCFNKRKNMNYDDIRKNSIQESDLFMTKYKEFLLINELKWLSNYLNY